MRFKGLRAALVSVSGLSRLRDRTRGWALQRDPGSSRRRSEKKSIVAENRLVRRVRSYATSKLLTFKTISMRCCTGQAYYVFTVVASAKWSFFFHYTYCIQWEIEVFVPKVYIKRRSILLLLRTRLRPGENWTNTKYSHR